MTRNELIAAIKNKQSFLCVGLDPDLKKIPSHLLDYDDPIFEFCKQIIEQTKDLAVAYKPNLAFFECLGPKGWQTLEKIKKEIPQHCFTIADAKRGDIGNTSSMYASTFFKYYDFDAVTVAPYMGRDSIEPFLQYEGKWVIVLGLTSNPGATDFEMLQTEKGRLYEQVIASVASWGNDQNTMFVVGATQPALMESVRTIVPNHFLLVPGIGAQGGDFNATCQSGINRDIGLLINSSRNILYASAGLDFAEAARKECMQVVAGMQAYL